LLLSEDPDAASIALRVGYRDASYFNREYKLFLGVTPMRDAHRPRAAAGVGAG
jgi:AraC-like DNA-binding protein